jgi:2-oxoisovalerate dehydrogenase E2 component (dihydrolipoyl transacylase)
MGIHVFKLPDIGEGTAEAELVAWHVKVGDLVEEDQPVADVMTDKATVEITAPVSGRIVALHGTVGEPSQVGSPFIEFGTDGEAASVPAPVVPTVPVAVEAMPARATVAASRPKTSPAVRRRAKELGIALEQVRGRGPYGRIRQADIDAYLAYRSEAAEPRAVPAAAPTPVAAGEYREVKLTGLRRRISEKMELSTRRIPHFSYIEEVDVTALEEARALLNDRHAGKRPKLSLLPFFIQALCRTLPDFPQINATYDEESGTVRQYAPVHVGIAAQTNSGLMVPVLRDAGRLGLWELASEISRLAAAARDGSAKREELSGSTITITSLGTLGGIATTPVINHPEVAIVGPNRIVERPVVRDGAIEVRKMMNISSSFDHRVVDGHDAARFIQELKALIEEPALLLVR